MTGYTQPSNWSAAPTQGFMKSNQVALQFSYLIDEVNRLSTQAKSKIDQIRSKKSAMSIADMFDLQMGMNKLSQFSEMSTSVIGAVNTSIGAVNRNLKG
jgi:hypothetical protein